MEKIYIKKWFSVLFIWLFIILFSLFESKEYIDFHKKQKDAIIQQNHFKVQNSKFSFDSIQTLDKTSLSSTPSYNVLTTIIDKIHNAQNEILLEVYMLTHKDIQKALIEAKKRGVHVKVILEKNPYKAYNLNNSAYKLLSSNGVNVVWSSPENYSLNHSKLLIIDDLSIISTGNFTHSTFTKNRDFFVFSYDDQLTKTLKNIFMLDYSWDKGSFYHTNIFTSPDNSRNRIEWLIKNAQSSLELYFPYTQDRNLKELLIQQANKSIDISLIIDQKSLESDAEDISDFQKAGIKVSIMKKPSLHAKAVLSDKKILYIGSINFSHYSLDENREIGLLIKNPDVIKNFLSIFNSDKTSK